MPYGYAGRILHANLSDGSLHVERPDAAFYRAYIGGSTLGLYYLLRDTGAGVDPLGPENILVFALSPLTGVPISGQSRATVVARSPLTGAVGDSQAGGFWPAELKFAGFDALVIRGAAETPVYLWIKDGTYELRDARHLWGKTTRACERALKEELGDPQIEVAQIGPAGERLVRFAAIMNMSNRAHGRTGMGAVMGSKRLKAIVVRGSSKKVAVAHPQAVRDLAKRAAGGVTKDPDIDDLAQYGTAGIVGGQNMVGGLVTRNWRAGYMEPDAADAISGQRLYDRYLRGAASGDQRRMGRDTCYACAVRCKRVVESEWQGLAVAPEAGGPEYETIATLGSYCGVDDLGAITYANQLCNDYGVDTISAGATMAFAIECYENGVIGPQDTGGLALAWGEGAAMVTLLRQTLRREGIGDLLAEGSARAATRIGNGAEDFVMASKGQELPAHMPHVKRSLALIYAVNPFGPDHQSSEHDPYYEPDLYDLRFEKYGKRLSALGLLEPQDATVLNDEKVKFALYTQYAYAAVDTLDVCQFVYGPGWQLLGMEELAELWHAVTDEEMTVADLQRIGARRLNMLRVFNAREGLTRDDDTLPQRLFAQPLAGGPTDGVTLDTTEFEAALATYYRLAGWDVRTGNPLPRTLRELDLGWLVPATVSSQAPR